MLELLALTAFISYIVYLRSYADQRSKAEIEAERIKDGILLYQSEQYEKAMTYFNEVLQSKPSSAVAYLFRARIHRARGDLQAALTDLSTGKSYDDTVAELHLESGQIQYQARAYQAAFQDFDKAVFHSHGDKAEPYHWRGLTRQHLQQMEEAANDLAKATQIDQRPPLPILPYPSGKAGFLDRQLLLHAGLTIFSALILLDIIKQSSVIHWPYLWAATSAVGLGFLEPRKGWALALLQVFLIGIGYYAVIGPSPLSTHREVELFSLYGSAGLTFAGSLIGSVLRKAYAH
ncbi:tetratricopeptide repeat protein [Spirosoma utsteinense]|uniref:Tetratricopeptide (TPR) repeat protein n=1 Tax=Spirosoma utsteinense TaxID=2585773 RepID=A0ABR6WFA9_9BACT|nr:tetratricopeptide repeat protein [Spirosoma utsteinense]MBC3788604.1 tetratricopeptide (TPR) repeat protein [Spirosoma utsteinense]MBC3795241.1 tetratricopeptide (TPR) repeat protein [Spirosoma utsteinense]